MASTGQHAHSPYRLLGHIQHSIFTVFDFLLMRTCCALLYTAVWRMFCTCLHASTCQRCLVCVICSLADNITLHVCPALSVAAHSPRTPMVLRSLPPRSCACTTTKTLALNAALPASTTSTDHTAHGRVDARRHQQHSAERYAHTDVWGATDGKGWGNRGTYCMEALLDCDHVCM